MTVAPEPSNLEHDPMTIDPANLGSVDPLSVEGLFLVALGITLHNAATLSTLTMDAWLTRMPVIGTIYEAWFKTDTYFRADSRLMYLDLIPNLVQKLSETTAGANGVRLVRQYQTAPVLGELYKPVAPREPGK